MSIYLCIWIFFYNFAADLLCAYMYAYMHVKDYE